jgi:glycosyltransferase involved in cell wall biosynthesis
VISIVTPAFNEAENLPALYERLVQTMTTLGVAWEWLVIDDHSRDGTFAVVRELAARDPRVRGIRFARNRGSHVAIACGLHYANGDAAVMLAADLQDPPETLGAMLQRWRAGAQVVWATRRTRPGDRTHAQFAAVYYWIMRRVVGFSDMPAHGADFFLADRAVIDAFRRFRERNFSVLALVASLGFRQEYVEYDKQARSAGQSGWTLGRKITLVIDSVTSFSNAPIRWCAYLGVTLLALFVLVLAAGVALLPDLGGGVLILLAAIVGLSGVQLMALAMVGEYVWRALDEVRGRPLYLVEAAVGVSSGDAMSTGTP